MANQVSYYKLAAFVDFGPTFLFPGVRYWWWTPCLLLSPGRGRQLPASLSPRHGPRLVLSSAGPRSAALLAALVVIVKVNFQLLAPIKLVWCTLPFFSGKQRALMECEGMKWSFNEIMHIRCSTMMSIDFTSSTTYRCLFRRWSNIMRSRVENLNL